MADIAALTPPAVGANLGSADDILAQVDQSPQMGRPGKNVQTTSFEDDAIKTYDFDLFKGRLNVSDRIGILVPSQITYGRTHFVEKVGYFICHSEWEVVGGQETCKKMAPCCEKLEAPDKRFCCLIIHYNTDPKGALIKPFSFALKLWRFSATKYVELRELNREWPLAQHDLKVNTTDEQYQRMTIQACKERVINTDAFQKQYSPEVDLWIKNASAKLASSVAKRFTATELLEKLGMAQAPSVVQQAGAVEDLRDLLAD